MWGGNASANSNRLSQTLQTCRDWMWNQCKGHWQKKLGFMQSVPQYTTLPKPKVGAKPSPAIFNPSLFLINPKLAQTSAFDSMTDEFAVVNVKRNGLQHLISPISHCEWDLGGVYGEKPRPLWWALPGDNEGHAAVLSASTDKQGRTDLLAAGRRLSIQAFICPYIFIWRPG